LFVGPVRGISEGGEVHFNGIKVGEVSKLALDPSDPNRVIARVRLTAGVPVRVDSYAILEPQGLTGVNYIQITGGTQGRPLLKDVTPKGSVPVIHSQKSTLADLLEGGGTVLQRSVETLDRVNQLLSDQNIRNISDTIQDFKAMGDELRERRALIADAQKAIQDADQTALSIDHLAKSSDTLVNTDAKRALANLADAAQDLKETSRSARATLAKLEGPTTDFANRGLPQLSATIVSLEQTSKSLDSLARELQSSPQGALAKPPAKELKVKP
jgi:phospholipid/cholesterol/gamma-HCH transport system substrate-binding protein